MICGAARCGVSFWSQLCGALQCGVTNKKYLRAADTKFCIRDITTVYIALNKQVRYCLKVTLSITPSTFLYESLKNKWS